MATLNQKRGWQWTDEEREDRKAKLRRLQNVLSKIEEQVWRINRHLPQFNKPASEAFHAVAKAFAPLKDLDICNQGRKYQPISPEEADRIFDDAESMLKPWKDFTSLPDYTAALQATNRHIRRVNAQIREQNRVADAAYDEMDDVLRTLDEADLGAALDEAARLRLL